MKTALRPYRSAIKPEGKVLPAMPAMKIETGRVASEGWGASLAPSTAPVAKIVVECTPTRACAAVSRQIAVRPEPNTLIVLSFIW